MKAKTTPAWGEKVIYAFLKTRLTDLHCRRGTIICSVSEFDAILAKVGKLIIIYSIQPAELCVLKQIPRKTLCTFWPLKAASVFNVSRGFQQYS